MTVVEMQRDVFNVDTPLHPQDDFYLISNHCEFATPPSPPYAQPICGGSPAIHQQKCMQVLQPHSYALMTPYPLVVLPPQRKRKQTDFYKPGTSSKRQRLYKEKETHLDFEGKIKGLMYRGVEKLWKVWSGRDIMYWRETTIIEKIGESFKDKIEECKRSINIHSQTTGASDKLITSNTPYSVLRHVDMGLYDIFSLKQVSGGYCVLNSICNALPVTHALSETFYKDLKQLGPILDFKGLLRYVAEERFYIPFFVKKVKTQEQVDLLHIFKYKESGVYAIQVHEGGHCYTWDANKKVIIDTDPEHPEPLDISTEDSLNKTLRVLGINTITFAYEIILRTMR
jgi:hypothetical protein